MSHDGMSHVIHLVCLVWLVLLKPYTTLPNKFICRKHIIEQKTKREQPIVQIDYHQKYW